MERGPPVSQDPRCRSGSRQGDGDADQTLPRDSSSTVVVSAGRLDAVSDSRG